MSTPTYNDTDASEDAADALAEHFYSRVEAWLWAALFHTDGHRAAAAGSNLRRALRHPQGQDAALTVIGEFPSLTRARLPRLWQLRGEVIRQRKGARARVARGASAVCARNEPAGMDS